MNENEVNSTEETNEVKASSDELETIRGELEELKREKETLAGELSSRDVRISELEQTVTAKDSELVTLKQAVAESEEQISSVNQSLTQAISSYKALVVQANPGIVEELISGNSIEEIDKSMEKAKTFVSRVKKELEAETAKTRVPAGAPERTLPDLSALSPREKIRYAIGGKR